MRLHSIIMAGMLLVPVAAFAQEATPAQPPGVAAPPSLSPVVPMPRQEAGVSGYRVLAIAAGAVVGVIAANFLSGGMITPILAVGTGSGLLRIARVQPEGRTSMTAGEFLRGHRGVAGKTLSGQA